MTILNLSAQQFRKAAKIKDRIASLENKINQIIGAPAQANAAPRKRRKMSAAGKAKIAAVQKARWAKVKERKSAKPVKKAVRKMSVAARAKIAASARARWKKAKAQGKNSL